MRQSTTALPLGRASQCLCLNRSNYIGFISVSLFARSSLGTSPAQLSPSCICFLLISPPSLSPPPCHKAELHFIVRCQPLTSLECLCGKENWFRLLIKSTAHSLRVVSPLLWPIIYKSQGLANLRAGDALSTALSWHSTITEVKLARTAKAG